MKKEEGFVFKGEWELQISLPILNKLDWEREDQKTTMTICDFLDDEIEPSEEQINAINYIFRNQIEVLNLIKKTIWSKWNEIFKEYEYDLNDEAPKIKTIKDLEKIISIHTIFIDPLHKNGISYIGLEGNCLWDQEHGIGLVIHKNRLIQFGGAEEANAMGISDQEKPDNEHPAEPKVPLIYSEHPKFNTLKPSHDTANFEFPYKLIQKGLGDKFIEWIEEGYDVDYIPPKQWNKESYLVTACNHDNIAAFVYLVERATNLEGAIEASIRRKNIWFIEILLKKGVELNESLLFETVRNYLSLLSINLNTEQMDSNQKIWIDYYNSLGISLTANSIVRDKVAHPSQTIQKFKKFIEWLKTKGFRINIDASKELLATYSKAPEKLIVLSREMNWVLSE